MKNWVVNTTIKTAFSSRYDHWKHGCVLELGGTIISTGINKKKPQNPQPHKYSIHAEAMALRKAGKKAISAELYVARITNGEVRNSKPCASCEKKIKEAGVRKIYYSVSATEWMEVKLW